MYFVEFNKDFNVELNVLSYPEYNQVRVDKLIIKKLGLLLILCIGMAWMQKNQRKQVDYFKQYWKIHNGKEWFIREENVNKISY